MWPWEAALGAEVMAPTLTEPVRVKIPAGSRAEGKLRLKGKGLPTAAGGHGDLFLTLQIVLPSPLTEDEQKLYEQLEPLADRRPARRVTGSCPTKLISFTVPDTGLCMPLTEYALLAFSSLFVIVDPLATVPAFLAMTPRDTVQQRLRMARVACLVMVGCWPDLR